MAEARAPINSARRLSTALILTCLAALGSLAWNWLFPATEPTIVQGSASEVPQATVPVATNLDGLVVNDLIPVYLVGAVCYPGIYEVERGTYLYQLVEKAGGLTAEAAADSINLAMRLENNQLIRLPTKSEAVTNPGLVANLAPVSTETSPIDLNQADQGQLDSLPGVGPSTALAILEYRRKNGSFKCVEDLMKVPGIKESRFEAIKDLVVVTR